MAHLKDLIVTGVSRFLGTIYGNLVGLASNAKKDDKDQNIANTYIKDISGGVDSLTITKGDGNTENVSLSSINADTINGRHCGRIATLKQDGNYWDASVENINDAYLQWDGSKFFRFKTYGRNLIHTDDADTLNGLHVNEIASNPNLLINPDLKINQRGKSLYIDSNDYTVDRWFLNDGFKLGIDSNNIWCISCTKTKVNSWAINQIIENYESLKGKQVTFSAYIITGETCFGLLINDGVTQKCVPVKTGINSVTMTVSSNATHLCCIISTDGTEGVNSTIAMINTKLELGSIATQFVPPDPAIELLKCQRFYYKNRYVITFPSAFDNTWYPMDAHFPVEMRPFRFYNLYSENGTLNVLSNWADRVDSSISATINPTDVSANGFKSLYSPNGSFSLERGASSFIAEFDSEILLK